MSSIAIPISKGYTTWVDIEDADLAGRRWHAVDTSRRSDAVYVWGYDGSKHKSMHRLILERVLGRPLERREQVDHIDHNPLNNRRSNLRLATILENKRNCRRYLNSSTGYKGVSIHKRTRTWDAYIQLETGRMPLGSYDTPIEAAAAYNRAAVKYFGEFACLNDVPDWQSIPLHPRKPQLNESKRNTSGQVGVDFHSQKGLWHARVSISGKRIHIGWFNSFDEALQARERVVNEHLHELIGGIANGR